MNSQVLTSDIIDITGGAELITEAEQTNRPVVFRCVIQRADAPNQNGRVYPRRVLEAAVAKYAKNFVQNRNALGELDHPESRLVVNLANVSHIIRSIEWDGNDVIGEVQLLDTPMGNIAKALLRANVRLGISSRGGGNVRRAGGGLDEVLGDFNLTAFDLVSNPSTHGAFLNESVSHLVVPTNPLDQKISQFFAIKANSRTYR